MEGLLKKRPLKNVKRLRSTRLNIIMPLAKLPHIYIDELVGLKLLSKENG